MRITPFAVLEQHARQEYARRFANVPEPRVLNARAVLQVDAPRSLVWGGVGYWAPSLSLEDGLRLYALSSYLHDAIRQGKPVAARSAVQTAAPVLRRTLHHRPARWWHFVTRIREAAAVQRAFDADTPEEVLALIRWLLHVEDESPVVPSDRQATVDMTDNQYAFEDRFKRVPRGWADYVRGLRYIGRATVREDLRSAVAARVGVNADAKGWQEYERGARSHAGAGWSNG